jgi:hypothetical protein
LISFKQKNNKSAWLETLALIKLVLIFFQFKTIKKREKSKKAKEVLKAVKRTGEKFLVRLRNENDHNKKLGKMFIKTY